MKQLFATLMLITLAACAQPETAGSGMMCSKCSCCQKMSKDGMQCPVTLGDKKKGMQCCCKKTKDAAN